MNIVPLLAALLPGRPSNIGADDWDDLFRAFEARLMLTVGERLVTAAEPQAHDTTGQVQVIVLECVAALGQLHTMLKDERDRSAQLELEVFEARSAMAQLRAELVAIHAKSARATPK